MKEAWAQSNREQMPFVFYERVIFMTLQAFFTQYPRAAVAFSGGVDSAFVLWAAKKYGCDVRAYYVHSAFQPAFELEDAKKLAEQLDIPMTVIEVDILSVPKAVENGTDRCYHCKHALFTTLWERVRADGYTVLLDGTNASDDASDRPGMRALKELSVLSPLRLCGVTKAQVREQSRQADLFTWDKPAYACLATRVPTGTPITQDKLTKIERAEQALAELGFTDFRVRLVGNTARLEMTAAQLAQAAARYEQIITALGADFDAVVLDLTPRRASR